MSLSIFDIDQQIADLLDEETGEVLDINRLDDLLMARDEKIQNLVFAYKNICAEVDAIAAQRKIFEAKEASAKKRAERCKEYLKYVLKDEKFKTPLVSIYYSRSKSVVIDDQQRIPSNYIRTIQTVEIDKASIKAAISSGESVPGARIEEKNILVVK